MPELEGRFRQLADDAGWSSSEYVHLNSGVFIGRRKPMIEFLEEATKFVTDNDLSPRELKTELKRKRKGGGDARMEAKRGGDARFSKGLWL